MTAARALLPAASLVVSELVFAAALHIEVRDEQARPSGRAIVRGVADLNVPLARRPALVPYVDLVRAHCIGEDAAVTVAPGPPT